MPRTLLVLQNGLGGIAVVDLGQQAPPRANGRLHHHRIAQRLDGLQGRFGGEGDHACAATGTLSLEQGHGGQKLVAAGVGHLRSC